DYLQDGRVRALDQALAGVRDRLAQAGQQVSVDTVDLSTLAPVAHQIDLTVQRLEADLAILEGLQAAMSGEGAASALSLRASELQQYGAALQAEAAEVRRVRGALEQVLVGERVASAKQASLKVVPGLDTVYTQLAAV